MKKNTEYPKDSMDRLGDDLTELVLSYLSFEDKVRFESMSTQWRRLVFSKQTKLIIDNQMIEKSHRTRLFRLQAVESVLNKCPHITTIVIQRGRHSIANLDQVFELIIKYCDHLHEFTAVSQSLSDQLIHRFFDKFGPKLKSLVFFNPGENLTRFRSIVTQCPQLESIKSPNLRLSHICDGNQVLVKSLKTFNYRFNMDDIERLRVFVDNNKTSLESLSLDMSEHEYVLHDDDHQLYDQLVRLTKLKSLRLTYEGLHKSAHKINFGRFVRQMADNCPKLSKLDIELYGEDYEIVRQTYQTLNDFKGLKHLRFNCSDIQKLPSMEKIPPLEVFEIKQLINLELMCSFAPITDDFFSQIAVNMPNLQTIFCSNLDITDKTLECLAQLSCLREITLDWNKLKDKFSDDLVLALISQLRKLKSFVAINSGVKTKLHETDLYRFRYEVPKDDWPALLEEFIVSRQVNLK